MTEIPAAIGALRAEGTLLGLRSGEVHLVEHNPAWRTLAEGLADVVRQSLDDYRVKAEHVGSTSVSGLAAKPLVDLAVGIESPYDTDDIVRRLETAGLTYQADLGMYGGLLFTVDEGALTYAHIHVVAQEDFQWEWYRAFRDGLRSDPDLRQRYEALKRSAAMEFASDREQYTKAKFDWVLETVTNLVKSPRE